MISYLKDKLATLHKFRIPTLLGLGIIILGIIVGVFLVLRGNQIFFTQATAETKPENIQITNIEDNSVSISWRTQKATTGFVTFGQGSPNGQTQGGDVKMYHHVTLKNLLPETTYQARITSAGKEDPKIYTFTTATVQNEQNGFKPVIGSVLGLDGQPIKDGLAYLFIEGAAVQSASIKDLGNFIIPTAKLRTQDLSGIFFPTENTTAKITIVSQLGQININLRLADQAETLGALTIGADLDLTITEEPEDDLTLFDIDKNRTINAADYSLFLKQKIDLNKDGAFDKEDVQLISDKVNQSNPSPNP